jgi:hypothetical protein
MACRWKRTDALIRLVMNSNGIICILSIERMNAEQPVNQLKKNKLVPYNRWVMVACSIVLVAGYVYLAPHLFSMMGQDWFTTYMRAARGLLQGRDPYVVEPTFFNPVWILYILAPVALLPEHVSLYLLFGFTLLSYFFFGLKVGGKPVALTAFLLSPPVLYSLRQLNIDVFILLGFLMPAPVGLFFVLLKPQAGIGIVVYWLIEAFRLGGIRKVFLTFAPVTLALGLTILQYGAWFNTQSISYLIHARWNYSIWPYGIGIGLVLLGVGVFQRKKLLSASSSVFLSPFVGLYSWMVSVVGLFENDLAMVAGVAGLWILVIIKGVANL